MKSPSVPHLKVGRIGSDLSGNRALLDARLVVSSYLKESTGCRIAYISTSEAKPMLEQTLFAVWSKALPVMRRRAKYRGQLQLLTKGSGYKIKLPATSSSDSPQRQGE